MLQHQRPYSPPGDFVLLPTADGSRTLRSERLGEQYHSVHGAVQESVHVFVTNGLRALHREQVDMLEIGLGTGLNLLLTWLEADRSGTTINYTAIEPFPVDLAHVQALDHPGSLGVPDLAIPFLDALDGPAGIPCDLSAHMRLTRKELSVHQLDATGAFDLVYYDAFAPRVQPEMWTLDVFQRMYKAIRPGGLLVTYCAKGDVRRAMRAAGFFVERLKGPPGKWHMLRATRTA